MHNMDAQQRSLIGLEYFNLVGWQLLGTVLIEVEGGVGVCCTCIGRNKYIFIGVMA